MSRTLVCLPCFFAAVFSAAVHGAESVPAAATRIDSDGVQRIRMVAGSYFFKPNHIVVKVRTPVEFIVTKEQGVAPHTLVLQAPQAGIAINEPLTTEPKTITFTPKVAGKYVFYCDNKFLFLPSHQDKGMEGILEVVDGEDLPKR